MTEQRKRQLIIIGIIIGALALIGLPLLSYINSLHTLTVTVSEPVSVTIFKRDLETREDADLSTHTGSTAITVQNGYYCARVSADGYDNTVDCLTLSDTDAEITLAVKYSDERLATLSSEEAPRITDIVQKTYPSELARDFSLGQPQVFGTGQWAGVTINQKVPANGQQSDVYRVVLRKVDGKWQIIDRPRLAVTRSDFPEVPVSVLDDINNLPGEFQIL